MAKLKQLQFRHASGSLKPFPGIPQGLAPKMLPKTERAHNINQDVTVLREDETHVEKINLLDDDPDFVKLAKSEEKMPQVVQDNILKRRADEYQNRVDYNEHVINVAKVYEAAGEIKDVKVVEVDPEEILSNDATTLDMSDIAIADHLDRGIPIPEHVRNANPERIAAMEAIMRNEADADAAAREAEATARRESKRSSKTAGKGAE